MIKLREIAHSRTGDKGNTSNISVIAYDEKHYPLLLAQVTSARVKAHFAGVVEGDVVRYELPNLAALNFVMTAALGGGVTRSLALDAHGKSLSSALLDLEIDKSLPTSNSRMNDDDENADEEQRPTLATLADDLDSGRTTARKLVDECLARIAEPSGEGARAFIHVDAEAAIEAAEAMDRLREVKAAPSRFAGIPVSIKDLFDIRGQVTRAGSRALDGSPPAEADAPAVARLRRAGFVVIGRTNMTEFAYSGIGINPHYGTPKGAWQRSVGHVPGGSSSGAAVSVVDGMAHGALGTDTGGSCRIPAAYNGIVGLQADAAARAARRRGAAVIHARQHRPAGAHGCDAVPCSTPCLPMRRYVPLQPRPIKGMRLAVPTTVALDDLDEAVAQDLRTRAGDAVASGRADRAYRGAGIPRRRRR